MADNHFDLIVVGGGPAGYVGAIRASQLGMKTAVVERDRLGGTCLNWGCIPTKALLKNASIFNTVSRHAGDWGISFEKLSYNWEKVIGRSRGVADQISKGVEFLCKKNKITVFSGTAQITKGVRGGQPCEVVVRTYNPAGSPASHPVASLTGTRVLIATGAVPRELPFAPFDGKVILSSKEAMTMKEQPRRMVIIGAGAIGVEFAYFYNAFGTKVTVVEMQNSILPAEDEDISKALAREFGKYGIETRTGFVTKAIAKGKGADGSTIVTIAKVGEEQTTENIETDVVLVAIGVRGRYDGLFDASVGIETFKDHVKVAYQGVDAPTYQTSVPGIYAVGDVIGPPWLAHVASEEAIACVERMAGHHTLGVDYSTIPGCTYCEPQVASIGKTERALKAEGLVLGKDYAVGAYPLKPHGKALAVGENVGLIKLITSIPHGEILGAHICGSEATEMISELGFARSVEATVNDLIHTMHAHPTMYEGIHEAALGTQGRMIHA